MAKNSARETARLFLIGNRWKESAIAVPVINPFTGQVVAEFCQAGKAEADGAMEEMTEPKLLVLNLQNC